MQDRRIFLEESHDNPHGLFRGDAGGIAEPIFGLEQMSYLHEGTHRSGTADRVTHFWVIWLPISVNQSTSGKERVAGVNVSGLRVCWLTANYSQCHADHPKCPHVAP